MIKTNFHTHTYRCKHAQGDIEDYCRAAVEKGIEVLAFTDHTPLPDSWQQGIRMSLDQLHEYCEKIEDARKRYPKLKIIKGLECEFRTCYADFYRDTLLGEYKIEMLVGGVHFFPYQNCWYSLHGKEITQEMLLAYKDITLETINSGLFTFLAHPDLFANKYLPWDEQTEQICHEIISAARTANIPLEINGYGVVKGEIKTPNGKRWGYPIENFWKIASQYDVEVVINSDAHYPENITGGMKECYDIARKYNLKIADMQKRIGY